MTLLRVYASELGLSREEVLQMENCGLRIRTIEDFLFTDTSTFRRYCNLNDTLKPVTSSTMNDGKSSSPSDDLPVQKLIQFFSAQNLNKAKREFFKLYTGKPKRLSPENLTTYHLPIITKKLNDFLDGGLPINKVTELRGDVMSGKTLFCLNIVLDLLRIGKRLLYIDTDYGMCSTVFFELLQEQFGDVQEVSKVLKRLDVCFVNTYQELVFRLDRLHLSQKEGKSDYEFLVIDSIVSPLAVECLSLKTSEGLEETHEKVNLFIGLITKLLTAPTAPLTILTTNLSKSSPLPKSWTNRCDLILELCKVEHPNSSCTFQLSTKKPFRCLSSRSCSNDLNRILTDNSPSGSTSNTQLANGNRSAPSNSTFNSAGLAGNSRPPQQPNGSSDMSDLFDVSLDELANFDELDSSPFTSENSVLSYTLSERGAINFLD